MPTKVTLDDVPGGYQPGTGRGKVRLELDALSVGVVLQWEPHEYSSIFALRNMILEVAKERKLQQRHRTEKVEGHNNPRVWTWFEERNGG